MAVFYYADPTLTSATLYALAQPFGLSTYANLSLQVFQTYSAAQYANYAITMTEGSPGNWTGTWPTWFPDGSYQLTIYEQAGGSPATTDGPPVGSGPQTYSGGTSPPPPPGTLANPSFTLTAPTPDQDTIHCGTTVLYGTGSVRVVRLDCQSQAETAFCEAEIAGVTVETSDDTIVSIDDEEFSTTAVQVTCTAEDAGSVTLTWTVTLDSGSVMVFTSTVTVEDP